ncbi:mobile mystery protein B [Sphingobacterium micropteri]|nr:mobile mystery protein B [Sphingobacterium micropteri]
MMQFDYPAGATPLDPEEADGLKLRHITTRGELDRWEQENIQDAIAWVERKRKLDVLTDDFICTLHQKMFGKIWKWAGTFRRTNKNIGVDKFVVGVELRQLLDDVKYWIKNGTYSPDEIACRFHHKLVWIHLFPNGNGRHARLITDILLTKMLGKEMFTWGGGSLTDATRTRQQYISALRAADHNDYAELSAFVRS